MRSRCLVVGLAVAIWSIACGGDTSSPDDGSGAANAGGASSASATPAATGTSAGGNAGQTCVEVTGTGPEPWLDVRVTASGFDAYDGERVRIVVALNPLEAGRVGVGETTIVGGAFDIVLPEARNTQHYTIVGVYIDADDTDACELGEPVWTFTTGVGAEDLVLTVTPDEVCSSWSDACISWAALSDSCDANGVDVSMATPCPGA